VEKEKTVDSQDCPAKDAQPKKKNRYVLLKTTLGILLGIPLILIILIIPSIVDTELLILNADYWAREEGKSARIDQEGYRWENGTYALNLDDLSIPSKIHEKKKEENNSEREKPNITFVFLSASQTGYTYYTEHPNGLGRRYYFKNGDKGTEVRFDKSLTWKQWILKSFFFK
jgi:hypothetical protein